MVCKISTARSICLGLTPEDSVDGIQMICHDIQGVRRCGCTLWEVVRAGPRGTGAGTAGSGIIFRRERVAALSFGGRAFVDFCSRGNDPIVERVKGGGRSSRNVRHSDRHQHLSIIIVIVISVSVKFCSTVDSLLRPSLLFGNYLHYLKSECPWYLVGMFLRSMAFERVPKVLSIL
jgi:hypothetical protein